jgi:hypothetical protein
MSKRQAVAEAEPILIMAAKTLAGDLRDFVLDRLERFGQT